MTNKILFGLMLVACAGAFYTFWETNQELTRTKAALTKQQQKVADLKAEL
jgi:hypothetical protein